MEYKFTEEELAEIQKHVAKYPDPKSAVMPTLWIAQEKFGWLSADTIRLVATTLNIPYALVYGVATFYTMYIKEDTPPNLLEVCTCFTCGECGGNEALSKLKETLQTNEKGYSADGKFWVRSAECLGACDTAPVAIVNNRRYVHNFGEAELNETLDKVRAGKEIAYKPIPLNDQSVLDA